jgi:hypothetical protein
MVGEKLFKTNTKLDFIFRCMLKRTWLGDSLRTSPGLLLVLLILDFDVLGIIHISHQKGLLGIGSH